MGVRKIIKGDQTSSIDDGIELKVFGTDNEKHYNIYNHGSIEHFS